MKSIAIRAGLMLLALVGPSIAASPIGPEQVEGIGVWGAADNVTRLKHIYFSAQPDAAGLESARSAGVVAVVDLRDPSERDWDERAAVEALGMQYFNVPVSGKQLTPAAMEAIEAIVAENGVAPILIHCSSANRAGAWLATHLVSRHELSVEEALAVGRRAGISKPVIEQRVRTYVEEQAAAQRAKSALAPFKKSLKATLGEAMQREGPTGALKACQVTAPRLAEEASQGGIRLGRTSHALRNPANAPAEWMKPLLEELMASQLRPAPPRIVSLGDGRHGYVEPIYVQPLCLTCHGENIAPALRDQILEQYPEDRATGFEDGDFRGMFWVEVSAPSGV